MRIEKIHIKGFRNFEDEEIFFQPKTLIIGANDVGKTNLLYALRILFDKSISEHDLDLKDSDYNAYCNTDTVEITATICDVTEECLLSTFGGAVKDGVVLIRYSNSKNGQYSIWMGYDENVLTEYSTRQYIKRLNMQYVDTNRDLFKFLKHERLQILHISKELLKEEQKLADEENTKEIQNKLNEINNQISSLNYVASALENVNIELSELSVDNEDQKIRFIAGESDAGKLLDNLTLSFSTGDNLLSIGGDGRNNQIFLATWIAKQNIQKNVDHVTFYAIEEPEAHLHPHQQRKLSTYIQEKFGEQVFITTHSPHIASKFNPANIVRLYTIKKKTYAACSGCSDFMKVAFQDFGYRLNALSAECFFVNGVFLVEGVSEVVYVGVDRQEEYDATKTSRNYFYRGDIPISWYGLNHNFDVVRKIKTSIIDKIKTDMQDRGRLLKRVCYEPGVGGTTLMRRIAWELREQYPTMILQKYNEQTAKNIQKVYDITHNQILIMVDNNDVELEEAKNLQVELKKMGFSFVICYFERKLKGMHSESGAIYDVVQSLNRVEALEMKNKLQYYIEEQAIEDRLNSIIESMEKEEKTPFIMAMYTFNENFAGIKPYIYNYLEHMNPQIRKMIFAVSLADYGNTAIDVQFFMDLFQDDTIEDFIVESMPGVNELVKIEKKNGKDQIRIRYHLFANEILRQMSLGKDAKEISFLNLVDDILVFIEDSRNGKITINQNTLSLMRSLFITRNADVDAEKPVFSPLIEKLKDEHKVVSDGKYDDTNDAIISIFNKLVETYPEEPHFTAHLARFYFYIDKNYDKGFANIDAAIALSESTYGYVDPLLYHIFKLKEQEECNFRRRNGKKNAIDCRKNK